MTKLELMNEIKTRQLQVAGVLDTIAADKREATNTETIEMDSWIGEIAEFETQKRLLEIAPKPVIKVGEDRSKKSQTLIASINDIVQGRAMSEGTLEVNKRGMESFDGTGLNFKGQLILPVEARADILAGTGTQGQEVVAEEKLSMITALRAESVLFKAGGQLITGAVGNISLPVYAGSSMKWKSEVATAEDGGGAFTEIEWSPKRLTGFIDVSKNFLLQDSASANAVLMSDLTNAIREKLEYTFLQAATGNTTQPAGLFNGVSDTSTGTTSYAKVVAMESAVNTNNSLQGKLAYITTPSLKGTMKTTARATGAGFVQEGEIVNGYPTYASSNVATGRVMFGNFNDFVAVQWGGIDITVDPYTQAADGQVRIVINSYWDGKVRRANSFSYASLT